jgi:hypothetical protein
MSEKCVVTGCNKKAVTKKLRLCKNHAKEIGIPGFKKPQVKRQHGYVNRVMFDRNGYPSCEEHGAMNCVNKETTLWRCLACGIGIDFGTKENLKRWLKLFR